MTDNYILLLSKLLISPSPFPSPLEGEGKGERGPY
jgi:hypothetical protein